jgi:CheY-specific phosphatase CheX
MNVATIPGEWNPFCRHVMEKVLESMFFEGLTAEPYVERSQPEQALWVVIPFHGSVSGQMWVAVEPDLAERLSGNFLGHEDDEAASASEDGMVACELGNMLCGSMLSHIHPAAELKIGSPRLAPLGEDVTESLVFPLETGRILVAAHAEQP